MRRIPVVATLIVGVAVAAMIALGFWQLDRRRQKLALLDVYAANRVMPAIVLPPHPDDRLLFRTVITDCRSPGPWSRESGRDDRGGSGWRAITRCRTPDGGILAVQMGVGGDALSLPAWGGGQVGGYLTHAPQHRALIAGAFDHTAPALMLMADAPLVGLRPNPPANLADVPNNHLAYAVQWFVFAALAAIIYAIAVARRRRPVVSPPTRG